MTDMVLSRNDVIANDGVSLILGDLDQTLAYNVDGTLNYIEVVYNGNTYRQTMTYGSGHLTGISKFVKQ